MVFTFNKPLITVGGVSITDGTGSVASNYTDPTDAHNYIVNLAEVTNAQYVRVELNSISESVANVSNAVSVYMGVLLGDVNSTGRTDAGDVTAVRNHTVSVPDQLSFRYDVNASGRIDAGDVTTTRNATVTVLP